MWSMPGRQSLPAGLSGNGSDPGSRMRPTVALSPAQGAISAGKTRCAWLRPGGQGRILSGDDFRPRSVARRHAMSLITGHGGAAAAVAWVTFLRTFALAAGFAGDKVGTSTTTVNGFTMNCLDFRAS